MTKLTNEERKELPKGDFVFMKARRRPIEDASHALARSRGKPEHATVVAAVKLKYLEIDVEKYEVDCWGVAELTLWLVSCTRRQASRGQRGTACFSTEYAALALQFHSGALLFDRNGPQKGDSG